MGFFVSSGHLLLSGDLPGYLRLCCFGKRREEPRSPAIRGWVRVRVLGYGFGVRGRKTIHVTD